jgi:hypothetical protein
LVPLLPTFLQKLISIRLAAGPPRPELMPRASVVPGIAARPAGMAGAAAALTWLGPLGVVDALGAAVPFSLPELPRLLPEAVCRRLRSRAERCRAAAVWESGESLVFALAVWDQLVRWGVLGWRTTDASVAPVVGVFPTLAGVTEVLALNVAFRRWSPESSGGIGMPQWCQSPEAANRQATDLLMAFRQLLTAFGQSLHDQAGDIWLPGRSRSDVDDLIGQVIEVPISRTLHGPILDFTTPSYREVRGPRIEELKDKTRQLLTRLELSPGTTLVALPGRAGGRVQGKSPITLAQAEVLVRATLKQNSELTSDEVGERIGCSGSHVRKTEAWKSRSRQPGSGRGRTAGRRIGLKIAEEQRAVLDYSHDGGGGGRRRVAGQLAG